MSKRSKPEEVKQETKKEHHERRKDQETQRRLYIGLGIVALLVVGLLAAAAIQSLIIAPRTPIANVNGQRISSQEYSKRVRFNWFQNQDQLADPQGSSLQVLDQMVDEELVREQAAQRGITVSDAEVTERIEKFFGYQRVPPTPAPTLTPDPAVPTPSEPAPTPLPTPTPITIEAYQKAYKDYLKRLDDRAGMSEADFRTLVAADLLRQKLYDDVTKDTPKTEEQVRARHILVRTIDPQPTPTPGPTAAPGSTPAPTPLPTQAPRNADQALALAIKAKQRLDAGEDFAAVAAELSDDTGSAANGGELGWFGKGMMVKEFEDAVFALQPGQISEPIKTNFGYHIIQLEEKDPARASEPYMLQQRQSEAFNTWLTDLRTKASIVRNWTLDKVPPTPSIILPSGQ